MTGTWLKWQQFYRELNSKSENLQPCKLSHLMGKLTLGQGLVNIRINVIYESGIRIPLVIEPSIIVLEVCKLC